MLPEWVAGYFRNQWPDVSGMGGRMLRNTQLTRFVHHPDIPMDNNIAEQTVRDGVLGRKNYYGSVSEWSAELTAWLFTILMTLNLWGINPKLWLTGYPAIPDEYKTMDSN